MPGLSIRHEPGSGHEEALRRRGQWRRRLNLLGLIALACAGWILGAQLNRGDALQPRLGPFSYFPS